MAAIVGRDVIVAIATVAVAGAKTKGLSIGNTMVDITNDDSSGWREMLSVSGQQNVDITVSGILVDSTLMKDAIVGTTLDAMTFTFPIGLDDNVLTGPIIAGNFKMTAFSTGEETEAGATFDATFNSSGVVTFTDGTDA